MVADTWPQLIDKETALLFKTLQPSPGAVLCLTSSSQV